MSRPAVVFSILGSTLDRGQGARRWNRWRPTVDLCRHEDFEVDRLELIHQRSWRSLAQLVVADIKKVSPATVVRLHEVEFEDPWGFENVYATLLDFVRGFEMDPGAEDYLSLIHI